MDNKASFVCYSCHSFTDGPPNVLPKGWIIPKHSIVDHQDINALRRTAEPGIIIALCSVACFNNVAKETPIGY